MQSETRKSIRWFIFLLSLMILVSTLPPILALASRTHSPSFSPLYTPQYHYAASVNEATRIEVGGSDGTVSWSNTANIIGPQDGADAELLNSSDNDYGCIVVSFGGKITLNSGGVQAYVHQPQSGTQDMGMRISVAEDVQGCNDAGWTAVFGYQEVGGPNSGGANWYGGSYSGDVRSVRIEVWSGGGNILHLSRYFYIDAVRLYGVKSPITVEVFDLNGNPVSDLTLNDEGWPIPNPLEVRMTVTNTTGLNLTTPYLDFSIVNPDNVAERRFYVLEGQGTYNPVFPRYSETKPLGSLSPNQSIITSTLVWIQPSVTSTLMFSAKFYTDTSQIDPLGEDGQEVDIPQAQIHPLVFLPGFLGTFPAEHGGQLDPLTDIYSNTIAALVRVGYVLGGTNSGATLILFGYDWRRPVSETGTITLKSDIQSISNTFPVFQKPYADYSRVDLVAHSMGGLISRAYIEEAGASNEATVNRLITLATPHQGTLAAYRGWYGGDPGGIIPEEMFRQLLAVFAVCKLNDIFQGQVNPPIEEGKALLSSHYYQYFRTGVPSAPDLLPPTSFVPTYLVSPTLGTPYPYGTPPSDFLDDLNTPGGAFDVTKLQNFPIIASYSLAIDTEGEYRVDPPPANPPASEPELWLYGRRNESNIGIVPGDVVVPNFSGDLTQIPAVSGYSNIQVSNIGALTGENIDHVTINNNRAAVRQIISYITGIPDIPVTFWNTLWNPSISDEDRLTILSCSPVRLLATDPQGRRAGLDLNTGQTINEIPGAFVSENGIDPQIIVLPVMAGQYQVQGVGVDQGFYTIGALRSIEDASPTVLRLLSGTATVSAAYNFDFTAKPTLYLPMILKNASGQATLSVPEIIGQPFSSPLPIPTPSSATIEDLIKALDTLYQQGQIGNDGIYRSLSEKLRQSQKHLGEGRMDEAIKRLETFVKEVENMRDKQLTPEAADSLLAIAQQLIVQLQQ